MALPGVGGSFRFRLEERLKKGGEIREVFKKGKRVGCRGAKLFVLENGLSRNRICFTFSRGFAGAVKRNRARRLGREAYRMLKPRLSQGYDLVLLVYPEDAGSANTVGLADRSGQLRHLFAKAGLTKVDSP
ncbi:MAG: ribonuclease P protein component [Treponema sp.]|nr:ribonuclease P protein component [Treponema sp.]